MINITETQAAKLGRQLLTILVYLDECLSQGKRLDQIERGLKEHLQNLGLHLLQSVIEAVGDGNCGPTVLRNGRVLKRSEKRHVKKYQSIFGWLKIERYVYSSREKQAHEFALTDEKLQLPKNVQSFLLEEWSQRLCVHKAYHEAQEILKDLLGIETTVRALEHMNGRMAKQVNGYWGSVPAPEMETEAELLVISADGKGVPMRQSQEDRLEQEIGKKKVIRERKTQYEKTDKRRGRGGRKSKKQMAYVACVYTVDRFVRKPSQILDEVWRKKKLRRRPKPQNKRYRAEMNYVLDEQLSYGQPRLFEWMAAEVKARNSEKRKTVVCLMDGQKSLWYWKKQLFPQAIGILDIFHVLERLWKAAHCFHPESSKPAEEFVHKYLHIMLEGNAGCVIGVFRRLIKKLRAYKKKELQTIIDFFHNNKEIMRYDQYIKSGYPIGSGVIEGACRHVVRDRMELTGMRWNVHTAQAMLRLRTTKLSGDWEEFAEYRIRQECNQLYSHAC